jgi:adenine-specific DNA methylase
VSERRKLIEVAMPLEAINAASAPEKSIRHGHPFEVISSIRATPLVFSSFAVTMFSILFSTKLSCWKAYY